MYFVHLCCCFCPRACSFYSHPKRVVKPRKNLIMPRSLQENKANYSQSECTYYCSHIINCTIKVHGNNCYDIVHGTYVVITYWRALQSNTQNCGHLKYMYVWNVYCVAGINNHGRDLQPQKPQKHEFPSVTEQISFI